MRREYPDAPIAGVGAVIVNDPPGGQKQVLLIRRAQEPLKGEWSLPGGAVELGETLEAAICRQETSYPAVRTVPAINRRSKTCGEPTISDVAIRVLRPR